MKPEFQRGAERRRRLAARGAVAVACIGFVALGFPNPSGLAHAAPEPSDDVVDPVATERWPLAPEAAPVELSGLAPSEEFTVEIPPGWAPIGAGALVLDYSLPALVESSAIGVELNDEFVDAVALDPLAGTAQIPLPAGGFRTGTNSIRVDATIGVVDDRECPDPWHPARVVTFEETSHVVVPLMPADPLLLSDLPEALEPVGVEERTVTVRFGPAPTDEDLTAAAAVIAALRSSAELDIDIAVGGLRGRAAAGPDVLIGVAADLIEAGVDVPQVAGGILEIGRNSSSNTRLLVSGSTPADVLAAARSIGAAPSTPAQLGIEPGPAPSPPPATERFTLSELGYPDRELVGPGVRSTLYGFDAPLSHAPTSMTLTVDAVRSASSDEVSGLSVFVNGGRVGTVHFDIDTGATSGVQLNVSGDDLRPGRNFVRIEAEFQGPPQDCDQLPPDESVEVSATTAVELVTNDDSVAVDLEDLPYLFRAPNDSAALVVVLPEDPSDQDLTDAIELAVVYGDNEYPASVVHAGTLDMAGLDGLHVIALGEPDAQPLHELIPGTIVATQGDAETDELVAVSTDFNGVVEVVVNPADSTRAILLATGFDAPGADLAQRVLLDPQLRGELYGRATFIGGTADNPVLAPVLEPVRVERGEVAFVEDTEVGDATTTSTDDGDDISTTVEEGTLFEVSTSDKNSTIGSLPFGMVGVLGVGAFVVGGGILAANRRRREKAAAAS